LAVGPAIRIAFFNGPCGPVQSEMLMPLIATLIANPARPVLDRQLADRAFAALGASRIDWLAEGIAADLILPEGTMVDAATTIASQAVAGAPVDIVVQEAATRRKKLLI